ncbi:MAG: ATP-binding cassette domain-containing protein, partial [Actinobacteria bacterium]|nr:ATP-binding cassette domain-containing protein [Actinomycetota bacterium]
MTSLYREPEVRDEVAPAALEFVDVFRIYRSGLAETVALRGLDMRIEPGEFVAVFGPSGSGKSTMLRLACGLEQPSAGEVRAFGRSLSRLGEDALATYRARQIAIVFQSLNLWPELTAVENVELALKLSGSGGNAHEALAAFGIGQAHDRPAAVLSGGEQ